jgi:phage gp45-like
MRKLLSAFFLLCSAVGAHAQSTSHSWIDVTASPYNAKSDCSVDAGSAIASAINNAPGTINGNSSLSVVANSGKTVTTDGTNCFAH